MLLPSCPVLFGFVELELVSSLLSQEIDQKNISKMSVLCRVAPKTTNVGNECMVELFSGTSSHGLYWIKGFC